jgi:glycosyltransferase involved in cell wall biosynthesis
MNGSAPELSIIIPSFNEEKRLPRTLERIREYLASRPGMLESTEVLIVDDGSSDGTAQLAREWSERLNRWRLVSNGTNRGKGFSVRHGMLEARGRTTLFTDADLSSPIEECELLFAALAAGNKVAVGSRALDRSLITVHQARYREAAGIIFNGFVRLFIGLPIHDTQCGFKAFVREPSLVIFKQQRIEGFGFDPEILFLARRHGLCVAEVPVHWANDPATKVNMLREGIRMFGDLLVIRWNGFRGRYPRESSHIGPEEGPRT